MAQREHPPHGEPRQNRQDDQASVEGQALAGGETHEDRDPKATGKCVSEVS
jgi:hypothetical protein